jgi:hypothetical protein
VRVAPGAPEHRKAYCDDGLRSQGCGWPAETGERHGQRRSKEDPTMATALAPSEQLGTIETAGEIAGTEAANG